MTDLRQATQHVVDTLENLFYGTREETDLAIDALKTALEQTEQKPVAWLKEDWTGGHLNYETVYEGAFAAFPVYKHPPAPQRPWVGLTEGDRNDLEDYCKMTIGKFAFDAIEAKLKEKNAT